MGLAVLNPRRRPRPRIGITTGQYKGRTMRLANALGVLLAGGVPVTLGPGLRTGFDGLDGLIIGGGVDVEARLYGVDTVDEWPADPARDTLELRGLDWAERHGRPVLGICRGAQLMNVHRGGTLVPDLERAHPGIRNPHSILRCKTATIRPGSRLAALVGDGALPINAMHHQAVDRLGSGMVVAAEDESGVVQAIERGGGPFRLGVQWHPEFLTWNRRHRRLFAGLVRAVGDGASG